MTISTKTYSTALSYLSIITNKTVEMIGMKIFRFVQVATLSHRHEETDRFWRFYEGTADIYVNREWCEWQLEWVGLLGRIFSTVQKFWYYSKGDIRAIFRTASSNEAP